MRKMDKELIDHIKDNLQTHEEAYLPGAWERFSVQEEKKRRGFIYWPLWSAAAIILVIGSVFFLQNSKINHDKIATSKSSSGIKKAPSVSEEKLSKSVISAAKTTPLNTTKLKPGIHTKSAFSGFEALQTDKTAANTAITNLPTYDIISLTTNALENQKRLTGFVYSARIALNTSVNKIEIVPEKKKALPAKTTFEQLLERDSYTNRLAKTEKPKSSTKWEPGIFVAPSMGNDNKVNMNYGFSLSYNLANKLSISSGIAYAALSSTSNPAASNSNSSDANLNASFSAKSGAYSSASKSLESINASVRGINIPLDLKYTISNKFYTGVGISALAVTNNKQDNNYLVSSAQNTSVANTLGITEQKMLIVTERVSETQTESPAVADKLIGFYNFSLGYKQKISKKNSFAVEPFLRVPMKTFSNDKLNLTNGGVRLKFDF